MIRLLDRGPLHWHGYATDADRRRAMAQLQRAATRNGGRVYTMPYRDTQARYALYWYRYY